MRPPVIAIAAAFETARWSVWEQKAALVPANYAQHVQQSGGLPVALIPDPKFDEARYRRLIESVDGLMLIGGVDLDPATYGQEPHPTTNDYLSERDRFEHALLAMALQLDKPILAICRGMQLLNVARGGSLEQHLPEKIGSEYHRAVIGRFDGSEHTVEVTEGSRLGRVLGETLHEVKSHHHQGLAKLGEGLKVVARSPHDQLVEAVELEGYRYVLGVQWHPEADSTSPITADFVSECMADGRGS